MVVGWWGESGARRLAARELEITRPWAAAKAQVTAAGSVLVLVARGNTAVAVWRKGYFLISI
jgi:hypothetical protein